MKKEYIRPEAEKINFQAEEVMTDKFPGLTDMESMEWLPST